MQNQEGAELGYQHLEPGSFQKPLTAAQIEQGSVGLA